MKNIKRIFLSFLFFILLVSFAGCTKDKDKEQNQNEPSDNPSEDTTKEEEEIKVTFNIYDKGGALIATKELKVAKSYEGKSAGAAFELLKNNFEVVYSDSEWGPYITSINNSSTDPKFYLALYENGEMSMVGINDIVVNDGDVYDFKVEQWDFDISLTFNVYDIDGELLGTKLVKKGPEFEGKKDGAAFDLLKENFDVLSYDSEWGPYIVSINGSVIDGKYYLALYENNQMSMVGINDIELNDGDVYDFKVECWDTTMTEADLAIDKLLYSFMKHDLDKVFTEERYGYTLLQAIVKMGLLGYDNRLFSENNIPNIDKYKESWMKDLSAGTVGELFKASLGVIDFDLTNETIKTGLDKLTDEESLSIIWTIGYYLDACYNMGVDNATYQSMLNKFADVMKESEPSDSVNMALQIYALFSDRSEYDDTVDALMTAQVEKISADGFNDEWSGNNASSTAQAILAMVASGVDPTDFNNINLVDALLKYEVNGAFKHTLDAKDADYNFDTPDAIAALLMYKAFKDSNTGISIYDLSTPEYE